MNDQIIPHRPEIWMRAFELFASRGVSLGQSTQLADELVKEFDARFGASKEAARPRQPCAVPAADFSATGPGLMGTDS